MSNTYITGDDINATDVRWTTAKGELVVTLLRNAILSANGYLPANTHKMRVTMGGEILPFCGAEAHAEHGYIIKAGAMGRVTVCVRAEHQSAVRAMIDEHAAHNAAVHAAELTAESAYSQKKMNYAATYHDVSNDYGTKID
ncbi:MAG: hypothetical protein H0X13_19910 [Ramlibacter sp.]|nr:hypothetical protein [Ramlibacter sp.]